MKEPVIPKRPRADVAPVSFAQLQMWLLDQMTPGNRAYELPVGFRLRGLLDAGALEASFNEIIGRHEALRTTFAVDDGEPHQRIHPECQITIAVTRLDHLTREERENRLHSSAAADSRAPFDLSRLPLIRVTLFKLDETEHVLVINLHHIVADGGSIGLMLNELNTFYRLFTGTGQDRPPDLPVQYADFALWQRQSVSSRTFTDQLAFWQQRLQRPLPVLQLPRDLPRPAVQSFNGSNVFVSIPQALARDLTALGRREGCTLYTTFLAAFQVLLMRYSGQEDLVIGAPLALRAHSEVWPLIGNFLNVVALRCDLAGNPSFVQLLRRSRRTTLHAFARADVPFEKVVENLTFERDPSRNPVFQVMLEALPATASQIGDLHVSSFFFDLGFAQFDLSLHLWEEPDGYVCRFEYCTDLFKADTIERMSSNFVQLLSEVVKDPEQRIAKIPILTASERSRVLVDWNHTTRGYAGDRCVHHLFEKTAATNPNRVAIGGAGRSLTYGELNTEANRLANHLIESGVKEGDLVGLYLQRSVELVIGLLGILKAGAAYVPMDPSFPPDRLAFMMTDAGVSAVLTESRLLERLPRSERTAICVDTDVKSIRQQRASDPGLPVGASSLAYVIYTSGSSGKPKGVMIEHRSLVNFLTSMQREPGLDEHDVLVAVTTISFDIAVLEILLPLVSGGRVVMAGTDEVVDGSLLVQLMKQSQATVLQATPSTWKLLMHANWEGTPGLKMLCGGEVLPRELANRLLERGGELWNMYGPTETTIWSSAQRIEVGEGPLLIGPPIANTQIYIVDKELEPVPIGVPGELLIGGDGVARGYLNRPDLTSERFAQNPFLGVGNRVYKTGDLARFRADGRIEFLGRRDLQVKMRGYRIELQEIEHVLSQHEGVTDAAVVTWEDQDGDTRLVAYYIPAAGSQPTAGDLRKYLREQLPEYMCPAFFLELKAFPFTPNGKVDRKAFPKPDTSVPETGPNHVEPQGELEVQLVAIWQEVLETRPIGIDDNFFELGGHSLLAARLLARIQKRLGAELPLATLFQGPTIRRLAERINQKGADRPTRRIPARSVAPSDVA